jgi:hypothetical protein
MRALARDWEAHGEAVIKRVKEDNLTVYFKGIISLLPQAHPIDSPIEPMLNLAGRPATTACLNGLTPAAVLTPVLSLSRTDLYGLRV